MVVHMDIGIKLELDNTFAHEVSKRKDVEDEQEWTEH